MALRHTEFTDAGAVVAAIDIDSPEQHAAMIEKLNLPFPMLSDPDRSLAIVPYGIADESDRRDIAVPTTVVIDPRGEEVWRRMSRDAPDRPVEDDALEVVRGLKLDPVEQPPPAQGVPRPGPYAMPFRELRSYYRGAKFAALAMGRRYPEAKMDGKVYAALMDRYMENVTTMYRIIRDKTAD